MLIDDDIIDDDVGYSIACTVCSQPIESSQISVRDGFYGKYIHIVCANDRPNTFVPKPSIFRPAPYPHVVIKYPKRLWCSECQASRTVTWDEDDTGTCSRCDKVLIAVRNNWSKYPVKGNVLESLIAYRIAKELSDEQ